MKNEINLGDTVVKISANYTNSRMGKVIEIEDQTPNESNPLFKKLRYRIHWTSHRDGSFIDGRVNGIRTWSNRQSLQLI